MPATRAAFTTLTRVVMPGLAFAEAEAIRLYGLVRLHGSAAGP